MLGFQPSKMKLFGIVVEPTVEVDLEFLTMDGQLGTFPPVGHKVTLEFIALCLLDIFSTCESSTCFKTKNTNPKCKNQTDVIIL